MRRLTADIVGESWRVRKLIEQALRAALTLIPLRELPLKLEAFLFHLGRSNERRARQIDRFFDGLGSAGG